MAGAWKQDKLASCEPDDSPKKSALLSDFKTVLMQYMALF